MDYLLVSEAHVDFEVLREYDFLDLLARAEDLLSDLEESGLQGLEYLRQQELVHGVVGVA